MHSRLAFVSPEVFAVDNGDRDGIEIEIVEQSHIDTDLGIFEVRLACRPIRRFRIGAAAAMGAEMMLDGAAAPQRRSQLATSGEIAPACNRPTARHAWRT